MRVGQLRQAKPLPPPALTIPVVCVSPGGQGCGRNARIVLYQTCGCAGQREPRRPGDWGDSDVRIRTAVARLGPRGDHSDRGKQRRASSGPLVTDEVVVCLLEVSEREMGCRGG